MPITPFNRAPGAEHNGIDTFVLRCSEVSVPCRPKDDKGGRHCCALSSVLTGTGCSGNKLAAQGASTEPTGSIVPLERGTPKVLSHRRGVRIGAGTFDKGLGLGKGTTPGRV